LLKKRRATEFERKGEEKLHSAGEKVEKRRASTLAWENGKKTRRGSINLRYCVYRYTKVKSSTRFRSVTRNVRCQCRLRKSNPP